MRQRLNPKRGDNRVFGNQSKGCYLHKFGWFCVGRHILVKGRNSPDDPALRDYWAQRRKVNVACLPKSQKQVLAQRQEGLCPVCGASLLTESTASWESAVECLEVHHKRPRSQGGDDDWNNLQLVHLERGTSRGRSRRGNGTGHRTPSTPASTHQYFMKQSCRSVSNCWSKIGS